MTWGETANTQVYMKEETKQESSCFALTSIELFGVCLHSSQRLWSEGRFDKAKCTLCGQQFRRVTKKKKLEEFFEYPATKRKYFVTHELKEYNGNYNGGGFDVIEAGNAENAIWRARNFFINLWNICFPQNPDGAKEVERYVFSAKIYES